MLNQWLSKSILTHVSAYHSNHSYPARLTGCQLTFPYSSASSVLLAYEPD